MNVTIALFDLGGGQVLIILVLILIFFGARRIPELAKGLGQGIKEFKKATREVTDEIQNASNNPPPAQSNPPARQVTNPAPADKPASVPQSNEQKV
jgi:sec-independent protein translocase protein TatA